ncbi:drug/metabolite transporter (DMT)-like permease [Herbaspirillum sp. Sphag1AN]|uniref:DMT family transporter n=1 Tax=unclassified Herbaspirillum TaxID=2624150 RepID=UPI00182BF777|nr:drug/metabolite transporter (DMT)-like permease [Herbaspirillum sp. Sphag1AN]MBB3246777.1 drug/metabolite transporter (DMT)-like permease [Herbaspirillum sp. Sphag64]
MRTTEGAAVERATASTQRRAKHLLILLGVVWGLNWPAVKVALGSISPWALRSIGLGAAASTLLLLAVLRAGTLRVLTITAGRDRIHVIVSGLLNIALFNILLTFAQLGAATSRVAIITYSMPLWTTLLAWLILGEKINRRRSIGLLLGATGLLVLLLPLWRTGVLSCGILLALAAAISWAIGTIYSKWANLRADPLVIAAWQLLIGAVVAWIGMLSLEGWPHLINLPWRVLVALAYHVFFGMAVGYILWFEIIARLPAAVSALGVLLVPVVGVCGAVWLLGDHPSGPDLIGFALIFSAAVCVLLPVSQQR